MHPQDSLQRDQPPADDDARLLCRIGQGDRVALETFVRRWETMMLRIACRIVGQVADAEEIRQVVLLRIIQNPGRLPAADRLAGWLRRCVVNESITWLRKKKRQRSSSLESHAEPVAPVVNTDSEMPDQLHTILATFDEKTRALLALRFDEGLTVREIGEVLEAPHTTIQSQLSSAIGKLRKQLSAYTA